MIGTGAGFSSRMVTSLGAGRQKIVFRFPLSARDLSPSYSAQTGCGTHQPIFSGSWGQFPLRIYWPVCEDEQLTPSVTKVNNGWSSNCTPPYAFAKWRVIKHRNNYILALP
jgi:hypothetical protein